MHNILVQNMGHFWLQNAKEVLDRSECSKAMNILLPEITAFIILSQSPFSSPWYFVEYEILCFTSVHCSHSQVCGCSLGYRGGFELGRCIEAK